MAASVASIIAHYSSDVSFKAFLTTLGAAANERIQPITDRFTSISLLVKYFSYDVRSFKSQFHALSKTFANTVTARRMYFNPIYTNYLLGVLYCFTQVINTFHTVLYIGTFDQDLTDKLGNQYLLSLR